MNNCFCMQMQLNAIVFWELFNVKKVINNKRDIGRQREGVCCVVCKV